MIEFRFQTLDKARQHAQFNNYAGAWFPWGTDDEERDITAPHYTQEIHPGIWIVLAAREYSVATQDAEFRRGRLQ